MIHRIKSLFPGFRSAMRIWRSYRTQFLNSPGILRDYSAEQVDSFNEHSSSYFENEECKEYWIQKPFSDSTAVARDLVKFGLLVEALNFQKNDVVLDFGCGAGWTTAFLSKLGVNVTGLDIAPEAIRVAEEHVARALTAEQKSKVRLLTYNGRELPFPEASFDCVFVFEAFHHLPNPMAMLAEFYRILKPNGRLAFAEPGCGHEGQVHSIRERGHGILERDLHPRQLRDSLLQSGYSGLEFLIPPVSSNDHTLSFKQLDRFFRGASWIVPADLLRTRMITTILAIAYKGQGQVTSRNPRSLKATINAHSDALSAQAGSSIQLQLKIKNEAKTVWLKNSGETIGTVRVGGMLLRSDKSQISEMFRHDLPKDVHPGETVTVDFSFSAPVHADDYWLRIDLVDDGICWFSDFDSRPLDIKLVVSP